MVSIGMLRGKLQARVLEATHRIESLVMRRRFDGASGLHTQIVDDLRTEGVHVSTIDLLLPELAPVLRRSFEVALELLREGQLMERSRPWQRGSASNDLSASIMLDMVHELYLLGLDPTLLSLVRHYLRLPVAYHGAVVRHSLVDGVAAGPRLWHQDEEDFRVLRMIVYLNDVTTGGGPFEYIPRSLGISYKRFAGVEGELT